MATTAYATLDDLEAFLGVEPPAGTQRLLVRAQELIDKVLTRSLFQIDNITDRNPTDAGVLATLKQATCAQVEHWINNGDELDELGNWTSYTIAGVTVTRDAQLHRRVRLCERARDYLSAPQVNSAPLLPGWISVG